MQKSYWQPVSYAYMKLRNRPVFMITATLRELLKNIPVFHPKNTRIIKQIVYGRKVQNEKNN